MSKIKYVASSFPFSRSISPRSSSSSRCYYHIKTVHDNEEPCWSWQLKLPVCDGEYKTQAAVDQTDLPFGTLKLKECWRYFLCPRRIWWWKCALLICNCSHCVATTVIRVQNTVMVVWKSKVFFIHGVGWFCSEWKCSICIPLGCLTTNIYHKEKNFIYLSTKYTLPLSFLFLICGWMCVFFYSFSSWSLIGAV